jgi:hypothetical protein
VGGGLVERDHLGVEGEDLRVRVRDGLVEEVGGRVGGGEGAEEGVEDAAADFGVEGVEGGGGEGGVGG